jgi:oligoribonuclease
MATTRNSPLADGAAKPIRSAAHLIWMDCEMTGLDPSRDVLLEIATIITDYDLRIVAKGPELAIKTSAARLARMDRWNQRTHTRSGLLDRIRDDGVTLADAEAQTLRFIRRHCVVRTAPLCGNSIGQDKRFLARHMPRVHAYLNYRVIDVSSIKLLVAEWYDGTRAPKAKQSQHRALSDISDSIAELTHYRKTVFVKR